MNDNNLAAREAAQNALNNFKVTPTSLLQYQSRGRVAVIGSDEAAEFAPRLSAPLQAQVVMISGVDEPGVPLLAVGGRELSISGHLGNFVIALGDSGKPNFEQLRVDMVIDMSHEPLLKMPMPPLGYFATDTEESSLSRVLLEVQALVGTFEKPRFFNYDAAICAHGRSGNIACTRCIDACPAEAITSLREKIEVDPFLCQGGGVCSTACPSGAISYSYPQAGDQLEKIKLLLKTYRQHGGQHPVLVFVAEDDISLLDKLAANYLLVGVEELASVGIEVWLGALAYGAERVELLQTGVIGDAVIALLDQQLLTAVEILQALGYPAEALRRVALQNWPEPLQTGMPAIKPATYAAMGGKRQNAFAAIDHLFEHAPAAKPMINLSVGAPFGMAQVEASRCTLCLSCVSACPGKALMQGEGVPQVRFIEANCLQCGMCTRTCPEDAISISPRIVFDRRQRQQPRVLFEEAPFECISCGKPFATRAVIDRMLQKLAGHWMFQDERSRSRLQMCEDCRVIDAIQDENAMKSGFEGVTRQ